MFRKSDFPQLWSVHAEFTISHPEISDQENLPEPRVEKSDDGVRMSYTWQSQGSAAARSNQSVPNRRIQPTFQKGNLFFTSTPPHRPAQFPTSNKVRNLVQDSGYGSDLLSCSSLTSGSLMQRPSAPNNTKCRSTCNIMLMSNIEDERYRKDTAPPCHTFCKRTQSLRCQTPSLPCEANENYYGCGDPWCHHLRYGDELLRTGRVSPIQEISEVCTEDIEGKRYNTNTLPLHMHSNRKDASVQTFDMIDKCTSPFQKTDLTPSTPKHTKKYFKSNRDSGIRGPIHQRSSSPSTLTPDSLDSSHISRLTRKSKLKNISAKNKLRSNNTCNDPSTNSRTVHIDVYCTDTEVESGASSTKSSDSESASTPQTVFESDNLRVTHKRAEANDQPLHLKRNSSFLNKQTSVENESEIEDTISTSYPSKLSSCSTYRDFSSSISSVPQSWLSHSLSTDSTVNTSWKDTFSDIESLWRSQSNISHKGIPEVPEIQDELLLDTCNLSNLEPSSSFEYDNSEDRLRIKRMEDIWRNKYQTELEKKAQYMAPYSKFENYEQKLHEKCSVQNTKDIDKAKGETRIFTNIDEESKLEATVNENIDKYPLNKSSSSASLSQRLNLDSHLCSPIGSSAFSGPQYIAKKFGSIVNVKKKLGHHKGPVKNPDCFCDHCQRHFEGLGYRTRSQSMGNSHF